MPAPYNLLQQAGSRVPDWEFFANCPLPLPIDSGFPLKK
jgi:hypothetical protein